MIDRGPMWWQRNPPEGWHFVKNVERAVVMIREWSEAECDFDLDTLFGPQRSKRGWCTCHSPDGSWLTLTGGGNGRPRNARRQSIANNDGEYRLRVTSE